MGRGGLGARIYNLTPFRKVVGKFKIKEKYLYLMSSNIQNPTTGNLIGSQVKSH